MGNQSSSSQATLDGLKSDLVAYEAETGTRQIEARRRLNELSRMQGGGGETRERRESFERIYNQLDEEDQTDRNRDIIKSQLGYGKNDQDILDMVSTSETAKRRRYQRKYNWGKRMASPSETQIQTELALRMQEDAEEAEEEKIRQEEEALAVGLPEGWSVRIYNGRPIYTGFGKSFRKRPQTPQRRTFEDAKQTRRKSSKRSEDNTEKSARCEKGEICSGCTKSECSEPPCSWDKATGKCKGKAPRKKSAGKKTQAKKTATEKKRRGCKNQTSEEECSSSSSSSSSSSKCAWYKDKCHTDDKVKSLILRDTTREAKRKFRELASTTGTTSSADAKDDDAAYKKCRDRCERLRETRQLKNTMGFTSFRGK